MDLPELPLPGLTGRGRRARWRRSVLRRVAAAVLAAGAVLLVVVELRPPPEARQSVVVAARALDAGTVLTAADVVARPVARSAVQPGALSSVAQAAGRRLVAGLAPEEALTRTRLVPRGPAEGLSEGRVALHVVAADPASVDLLLPGSRVRVYPAAGGTVLVRAALVLAADPAPPPDDLGRSPPVRGVVIALSEDEADTVVAGHGGLEGPVTVGLLAVPP